MRIIYKHENRAILHSVKNILDLNGIDTYVKYEHTTSALFVLANIELELWVLNDKDYDRAFSIIEKQITAPLDKKSWVCAKCGEENDGSFESCWNCRYTDRRQDDEKSSSEDPGDIVANPIDAENLHDDHNRNRNTLFSGLSGEDIFLIVVILCLSWIFVISMLNT